MATSFFRYRANAYLSRSHVAGNGVVLRSTEAGDDSVARVYGTETTSEDLECVALATVSTGGKLERYTDAVDFDTVDYITAPSAHTGIISVYSGNGAAGSGDARIDTNPSDADTLTAGPVGFETVYEFKNTVSTSNQVKIGGDTDTTAANLKAAIEADGTPGTEYGTGTTQNSYISATVAGSVVTITDRIPCARQLGWTLSESASNFTLRTIVGGTDGTFLGSLGTTAGDTIGTAGGLDLNDPAATADTLPIIVSGATSYETPRGRCSIYLTAGTIPGGDIALKYQVSTDATNWTDGATSITNLATDADQIITPAEHIEYIRLNITANTLTGAIPLDARIVY